MDTEARVINPKIPLRNWRVVLDKIATILVLGAGFLAAGVQVSGQRRGLLRRGDHEWRPIEATQVEERTYCLGEFMHPPEGTASWGRQWDLLVRGVPSVPFQVGPRRKSGRHPEAAS